MTWSWLKNGYLKKETKEFIMAAQEQAIRTNAINARKDKTSSDSKYQLCKVKEETIDHLMSSCSKIVQRMAQQSCINAALEPLQEI